LGAGGAGAADGGDNSAKGGDGGGYISLTASGTITVNGSIYANGQNPWHFVDGGGGGGGGVIKLVANTVAGTPKNTISARGGNASDAGGDDGGGGGGGIIYIGHSSGNSILSVNVSGGTANGVATAGGDGVFTVEQLNTAPTVTIDSAEQDDNEGTVYVTITISDSDGDDTLNVKVEYKAGADCSSGTSKPDLSEESADLTSTQFPNRPKPSIENDNTYQIGDGNGDVTTETWIETDPGVTPNELEFVWNSATDEAAADGTYCIKVTPNDNTSDGTSVTETLVLDNVDPVSAGDLTLDSIAADSLTLMRCLETRKPGIPPEFVKECDDVLLDLINRGLVEAVRRDDGTAGFRLCE